MAIKTETNKNLQCDSTLIHIYMAIVNPYLYNYLPVYQFLNVSSAISPFNYNPELSYYSNIFYF